MKKLLIALGCALLMFTVACEGETPEADFTHKYEQTQCSDPWGNDSDPSDLEAAVVNYLQDKLIEVIKIEADEAAGNLQVCLACSCTTGTTIFVQTSEEDGQKLLDLNEGWEAL